MGTNAVEYSQNRTTGDITPLPNGEILKLGFTAKQSQIGVADPCDSLSTSLSAFLSVREIDIVRCLLYGNTAKKTAKELFISPRTVERHLENIKAKFSCRNKYELVKKVYEILNGKN